MVAKKMTAGMMAAGYSAVSNREEIEEEKNSWRGVWTTPSGLSGGGLMAVC